MLSIEDEDNPLAALIKKADEEGINDKTDDPIIVFNEANDKDEDENDNGPINLSVRQPSFSHLTVGNLVPKGGNESITTDPIKENEDTLNQNHIKKSRKKLDSVHTSSYANIHFTFSNDSTQRLKLNNSNNGTTPSENRNNNNLSLGNNNKPSSYAHLKIPIEPGLEKEAQSLLNPNPSGHIENCSNPVLVITGDDDKQDEENDEENVPIGLSVRQPSFASLCNHIIPKGGLESGDIPVLIEEEPEQNNKRNEEENSEDNNVEQMLGLQVRQSSYANLKLNVPTKEEELPEIMKLAIKEEEPQNTINTNQQTQKASEDTSNPIIVLTGDNIAEAEENDEENVPIGLSVRQPSFASLCNHIIPKGGLESGEMPIVIEEEPEQSKTNNKKEESNKNDDDTEQALGLQVRQSSYANLKLNVPTKEEEIPDIMKLAIKEEKSQNTINPNTNLDEEENPILVLTGNDDSKNEENDDENVPIGLSVRQPSFASLCNHIVPKGGLESGDMPIVIEEEAPPEENIDGEITDQNTKQEDELPMVLNVRQSSYANLHFGSQTLNTTPTIEPIPDEEAEANTKKADTNEINNEDGDTYGEDAIIVLTNDNDTNDDAPIGLSVRQPSFASLHGNVVPKGGFQSLVAPITEELKNNNSEEIVEDKEISDVDIDDYSDDDAEENNNVDNNNDNKKDVDMKNKILNSLLSANKEWWEEIGYKPPDNLRNAFKRNCSMFQMPPSKNFMMKTLGSDSGSFASGNLNKKRQPSHSLYQGAMNNIEDLLKDDKEEPPPKKRSKGLDKKNRGPSIYRVNSYGNKGEQIEVEMPLLQDIEDEDEENVRENPIVQTKITKGTDNKNNDENESPQNIVRGPSLLRVSSFGNASKLKVVEMPDISEKDTSNVQKSSDQIITENKQSNKSVNSINSNKEQSPKESKKPSIQRVSSFGNASTLKIVEMPSIDDDKQKDENLDQIQENDNDQNYDGYEEEEEEDESGIPPNILKLMKKPRDPIVLSALSGEPIGNYKREIISKALSDLQTLNKKCQNKEYTQESEFITQVIDAVRSDAAQYNAFFEVEEQMRETEVNLQEKLTDWQNMYEELDEEYQNQLNECEAKYQEDLLSLEKQYHNQTVEGNQYGSPGQSDDNNTNENGSDINVVDDYEDNKDINYYNENQKKSVNHKRHSSITPNSASILSPSVTTNAKPQKPQKRSKAIYSSSPKQRLPSPFSKPLSPKDAKMKEKVQKMIKAQRFEEGFELSLKFYKKQMVEHQKQVTRRSQAYLAAKTALRQKHEDEKNEIILNFQSRRTEFTKKREQSLVPLREQLIQLRKVKTLIEEGEKNEKFNETMQPRLRASRARKGRPTNLALPPLSRTSAKNVQ